MNDYALFGNWQTLTGAQTLFVACNAIIVLGYVFVALRVTMVLPVRLVTRVAAVAFFFLCAATHFDLIAHTLTDQADTWETITNEPHMWIIHLPQAIAVWVFVVGLYADLRALRDERGTVQPATNGNGVH